MGWVRRIARVRPKSWIQRKARRATVAFSVVVQDKGIRIVGSGVLVHRSGVVVTAAHVMQSLAQEVEELRDDGETCDGRVMVTRGAESNYDGEAEELTASTEVTLTGIREWAYHEQQDLAIVRTMLDDHPKGVPDVLPLNDDRLVDRGTEVGACGYPYGIGLHEGKSVANSFLCGHVSAVVPVAEMPPELVQHYLLQMPVNPGNSGGPVFSPRTGEVHAVVSRRFEPEGIPAGLCIAVPVHGMEAVIRAST